MTLEKGIHGWVVTATGLAADRVRWAKQGQAVPRPAAPGAWVSLSELGREAGGADWQERASYPLTFADLAVAAVNAGADTLTITAHGRATGDGPVRLETTGVAPGGLAVATDYWLIVVDANTVQLAATFLDAIDLVEVAIADAGSGAGGSRTPPSAPTTATTSPPPPRWSPASPPRCAPRSRRAPLQAWKGIPHEHTIKAHPHRRR